MKIPPGKLLPLVFLALSSCAYAQAYVTFDGGLGAPVRLTLNAPVTYQITSAPVSSSPFFVIDGVGNFFGEALVANGTITFSINGGPARNLGNFYSNVALNSITADDVVLQGETPGVAVGDLVTLSAGTLTSTSNYAGAGPANGYHASFVSDFVARAISPTVPAPEPSTWAGLVFGGLIGGFWLARTSLRRVAHGG